MNIQIFIILFVTAIVGTGILTWIGSNGGIGSVQVSPRIGIVVAAAMVVLWGLVGINAYEITIFSGDQTHVESYPQLGWIAIAGGAVSMYVLVEAAFEEIEQTGGI